MLKKVKVMESHKGQRQVGKEIFGFCSEDFAAAAAGNLDTADRVDTASCYQ